MVISGAVCISAVARTNTNIVNSNKMKYLLKCFSRCGCFLAPLWFWALPAQAVDLEGALTSDSALPADITIPSFYTLNGEAYSGEIDSFTNIAISCSLSEVPSDYTITRAPSSLSAGNLTYNIVDLPENFWDKNLLEISGSRTISVENLTVNLRDTKTSQPVLGFQIGSGATLETRGDFLFFDARSSERWYMTRVAFRGSGNVKIGGDFTIDSQVPNPSAHNLNSASLYVYTRTFSVGGVLTVKNSNGDYNILQLSSSESGTFTRTLGGLSITQNGMIQLGGNVDASNTTEMLFTNSGTSEYTGGLLTIDSAGELADNKLNVRMTASDAANGRQIMRFTQTQGWSMSTGVFSDSPNALNEVEVSSGRLDLGMYGGMKGGSLMIMGYNRPSEAVFSATGTAADTEIGRVVFDTMSFYRGTVVFDLAETDGDFIQVDGAMTKVSGASPLVLELNVSAYDLQEWIGASESDEWSADLMSFATEGSNVSADDFTLKLQDGITGKISISELDGISTITANLSIVPEPAEIAAAIGLAALAFAARRRRG